MVIQVQPQDERRQIVLSYLSQLHMHPLVEGRDFAATNECFGKRIVD
jgi:hypothetical protein